MAPEGRGRAAGPGGLVTQADTCTHLRVHTQKNKILNEKKTFATYCASTRVGREYTRVRPSSRRYLLLHAIKGQTFLRCPFPGTD